VRLCAGADFSKLVMAIFLHYFVTKYRYLHKIDCIYLSFTYQLIIWLLVPDFIKKIKGKKKSIFGCLKNKLFNYQYQLMISYIYIYIKEKAQ
jgi:hypothetical protein